MSSNHLIFCHPLLLLPSIFPSLRVSSNESALAVVTYFQSQNGRMPSRGWEKLKIFLNYQCFSVAQGLGIKFNTVSFKVNFFSLWSSCFGSICWKDCPFPTEFVAANAAGFSRQEYGTGLPFPSSILGWTAIPASRGSSHPRDQTQVSLIAGGFFTVWATRKPYWKGFPFPIEFIAANAVFLKLKLQFLSCINHT